VATALRALPKAAMSKLFSVQMNLFHRQTDALKAVESFCYESVSRFLWKTFGGHHPATHSGVPGVEALGSNNIQRMWTFFNEVEEQRIRDMRMWEGFKLSASAQSPKGVKKIDQRDHQDQQKEQARRQALQDRFYYIVKGVLTDEGTTEDGQKVLRLGEKTADDLADEMHRWVTGQDDEHDKIIREYKQRIIQRYEQEKKARNARLMALKAQQELDGSLDRVTTPLVGYTQEQLQNILREKGLGTPGVSIVSDGRGSRDYLYNRYLERVPDSGLLKVVDGQLVPSVGSDLTETLMTRQVSFRTGEED
jgi:hypothetical protein